MALRHSGRAAGEGSLWPLVYPPGNSRILRNRYTRHQCAGLDLETRIQRLRPHVNSDLKKLVEVIRKGTVVVIIPSAEDVQAGAKLKMPAPQNKKPEALPPPVVY